MNTTKTRRHIGRLTLLALLAVLALALTTACDELGSDEPIETHDDTFQVSGTVTLDVDVFNGPITVESTDSGSVRVQATLKRADHIDYEATQFGSDIQVKASRTGSTVGRSPSVEVEISAPANSELVLRTSNGAIEIRAFEAGATLRTSNGRITVNGLLGDLDADTSNGRIEVTGFAGSAELETSNGSINFEGELVAGSVNEMTSSNGSITVDLEGDPSVEFDGSTSNGSVSSDLAMTVSSAGRNHLEGVVGNGDPELTVRTSNGSISLR